MKKWIVLVLCCCLIFTAACAEDYSSVTTDELLRQNERIMQELAHRRIEESGRLLVADEYGVQIYFDGFADTAAGEDQIQFMVLNQSDEALPLEVSAGSLYIDQWDVLKDGYIQTLDQGKNGVGQPLIDWGKCASADKSTASRIDVKFVFKVEREGSGSETVHETDLLTFFINGNKADSDEKEETEPPEAENTEPAALLSGSVLECSGELVGGSIFTGPEEVTIKIEIRNAGDEAFPAPLILYYPDLKPVEGFGSEPLAAGASESWEGTWTITDKELKDGEIPFYVRYPLTDEETGELTYKAKKLKFRITVPEPEKEEKSPEEESEGEEEKAFPVNGVTTASVNMRSGPSKNNGIIRKLKKGQECVIYEIVVNEKNEQWARVEINGKSGYVMMEYLEIQ